MLIALRAVLGLNVIVIVVLLGAMLGRRRWVSHQPDAFNQLDPGVAAIVAHHLAAATTIVVLGNQDRGSWPVYVRLAAELGLPEEDRRSGKQTRRSPAEVSRLVRHRARVAVAGRIGQYRQFAGPAGRSAVGRDPEPQQRAGAELGSRQVDQESRSVGR